MTDLPETFAALADETRFAILERLLEQGACTAGELGEVAPISAPAISRHLKVLRKAGVITQRVEGPKRIYTANPVVIRAISDWTLSHRAFWEGSLYRLEQALKSAED
ncbi:metalloregulator ArsR/SmtB family transcription factor [Tropicimonas sp. TH_r6]|uniref:ArsR/SmtB family transcription factor n=1 Tax=Tropicimonas sp. TH_r6 TaxID=3082085 RepID=UPI002953BF59|nr:metalloregulator ArsR/SmtB family transcription factor [Tropicimonas sp. TH_r6]MDV7144573.1 metalloregulator ArsR/SmtB family transcription factor [Tropicimonas sp. TH_r6]